jgi:CCR4-NOT transcription complex subunit 6
VPSSAVYELLSGRGVNENHEDLKCDSQHLQILPQNSDEITHDINLVSAYHSVLSEEPKYTNFTTNFVGVLDYIWCSSDHLRPLAVVPVVNEDVITKFGTALPNTQVYFFLSSSSSSLC